MAIPSFILTLLIILLYSYFKVKSYEFSSQNIKTTSLFDFHIGRNIIHLREDLLNNLKFIINPENFSKNQVDTSLEVKDLKVEFHTPGGIVNAVNGISYKIYKGLTTAIVGESGCGKTVSSMALMKLIPIPPGKIVNGEVWYKDTDLIQLTEDQLHQIRGKDISIIFQDPMTTLNPYMKLGEQLIESLIYHFSIDRKTAYQKAIQLLERVKLPSPKEKMNGYPYELSGGMRQRVTIAIALACEPEVIIADEPTTDLDVTIQAQILDLLKELRREKDLSIILITHDIALVSEMCENILVMYAGYIVEKGTTKEVLENPKHPYTEKLIESVPFLDKDISRLSSIEGSPPDLINLPPGCPFYKRCDYHKDICKEKMPPERKVTKIDINQSVDNIHTIRCWVDIEEAFNGCTNR
jgi:oligopeptide transport system ATP-binding protein